MSEGLSAVELELMRSVEDDHWWYRALHARALDALAALPPEFKLLDAGCGSGGMLTRIREKFPRANLTGLDLSEHALQLTAARKLDAPLSQGNVNQLPFGDAEFDAVLSLDVIYHRDVNDGEALREMHRVLRIGGLLIVNVPAFKFLRGSHDVAVNTARRYTRPQLSRLLDEIGFTVGKITYWNMILLPAIAAVRWASRGKTDSDLAPPSPAINRILGSIMQFELALSRSFSLPFGTSLFAIARK